MSRTVTQEERYRMMTEKPISRLIPGLAVPTIISMLITSIYNMADTFFVSQINTSASAAVGIIFSLMAMIQAVGFTLGMGAGNYISRSLGAKNEDIAVRTAATAFFTAIGIGVVMAVTGLSFLDRLVRLLGATETIAPYARDYARYILLGAPVMTGSFVMNNLLRSQGYAVYAMAGITTGGILNMILDPVLILGPGPFPRLGVTGAAIATVTAQAIVMSIMILGIIARKKENVLKGTRLFAKIPVEFLRGICRIGIPTALQGMAYCGISMILTRMVSGYGAEAVATQRVGGQIESISWNTADGFAAALNAFVAQNYGAGERERVRKGYQVSLWTVGIWGVLVSAVFICFPNAIADIFFHEPKAVATAVGYLVIIGFSEAFMCVELTTIGALSGLGRTRLCSVISIVLTSARIPLAIVLSGIMGLDGIWWALTSTSIVKGIIFTCTFFWIMREKSV